MTKQNLALVEDDPDLSTTLTIALERDGYRVARFATGREGLEGILDNPPDLVILDLNLPDLDGLGVCRELRETPAVADLPIIILTARVTESDRVLGVHVGGPQGREAVTLGAAAVEFGMRRLDVAGLAFSAGSPAEALVEAAAEARPR